MKKKEICGYKTCDNEGQKVSKIKLKNKDDVLTSFIMHREQKPKFTNAQNEETGLSNGTVSKGRPEKCIFTGENEQLRPSNLTRLIQSAKPKGIEKMSEVMTN